tara:strand:- start:759 stop:1322 length:564 start_codon:yes stop_codon:yes gene_type:complete
MNYQKLIIYDFNELFDILNELRDELNIEVIEIKKNKLSDKFLKTKSDYLIVTRRMIPDNKSQILITRLPIKISKLMERLNINYLKKIFKEKSEVDIGNYKINLNSREIMNPSKKIKLTEKESGIIIYLSKSKQPIKIEELQFKVWGYRSQLETHTVETHIYRLRKKIFKNFNDKNFIISKKNGYQID